ncbi:MAG TPA: ATP-binding cassette domain-containing protein [Chloroflexia bacterium]|nr:ATP-binding cassette domain-containing protein [Chloroflexia bacterium]
MPDYIVETENLTKQYGSFTALHELNLSIERGSIHGFIGPNGAGKTTTMRILATLLEPTSGQAWVSGYPVTEEVHEVRRKVGYMPDFFGVYDNMKVWEYLDFFAAAYHVPQDRRKGMIDDLLALVDLGVKKESFVEELSRGMKQRLCLARTLVHEPDLLILDEPASGLDPHARIELRELLKELRSLGKTILVSSHILTELAEMCTHVAIIERGKLLVNGGVKEILFAMQPAREVYVRVLSKADEASRLLSTMPGVLSVRMLPANFRQGPGNMPLPTPLPAAAPIPETNGSGIPDPPDAGTHLPPPPGTIPEQGMAYLGGPATLHTRVTGDDALLYTLLSQLVGRDIPVYGFEEVTGNLEDIFLRTTKGLVQ